MAAFNAFELRIAPAAEDAPSQSPLAIGPGQSVELRWQVTDADFVKIVCLTPDGNGGMTVADAAGPFALSDPALVTVTPPGACQYQILAATADDQGVSDWSSAAQGPTVQVLLAPMATLTLSAAVAVPGQQLTLTVAVQNYASNVLSLSVSPDPGDGTNGQQISADATGKATVSISAPGPGTYTYSLAIDGQFALVSFSLTVGAAPSVDSFAVAATVADGGDHPPDSLELELGQTAVLSWSVSNADSVELTDPAQASPQTFDASTTTAQVTPQQEAQDYLLVALSGSARSAARSAHVSTHPPGTVYSPHAQVLPAGAPPQVNYFRILASGGDVASATNAVTLPPGAAATLSWEVEGDVLGLAIDQGVGDVTAQTDSAADDTSGEGSVGVTLPSSGTSVVYTLTLTPADPRLHPVVQQVTATLQAPPQPPQITADAEPKVVSEGAQVTVTWSVAGDAATIGLTTKARLPDGFDPTSLAAQGSLQLAITADAADDSGYVTFAFSAASQDGSLTDAQQAVVKLQRTFNSFHAWQAVADGIVSPVSADSRDVQLKMGNAVMMSWDSDADEIQLYIKRPDGTFLLPDPLREKPAASQFHFVPTSQGDWVLSFFAVRGGQRAEQCDVVLHVAGALFTNVRWASGGGLVDPEDHLQADTCAPDGTRIAVNVEYRPPRAGWTQVGGAYAQAAGGGIDLPWTSVPEQVKSKVVGRPVRFRLQIAP